MHVEAARNERVDTTDQNVEPFLVRQAAHRADHEAALRQTERGLRLFGGALVLVIALAAVLAPLVAPHDPDQVNLLLRTKPPGTPGYLLGTDIYGRDLLSRLIWGGRVSLTMGLVAMALSASIGICLGVLSGYLGGRVDTLVMRVVDVMFAIPFLFIILVAARFFGQGDVTSLILILGLLSWPLIARLVRAQFLSLREADFVDAARAVGVADWRIAFRHVLPNALAPLIVQGTFVCASAILVEATLSFLGIGIPPETPTWGNIMAEGRTPFRVFPHNILFPGIFLAVTILSVNMLGDGLRDSLDPRMRNRL